MSKIKFGITEIIASAVGVLLFVLLEWFEKQGMASGLIESAVYGWLQPRMVIVTLVAALFGPVSGLVCGVGGSLLINSMFESFISYTEVMVIGLYGYAIGRMYGKFKVYDGSFGIREFVDFGAVTLATSIFCGVIMMPMLGFLIEDASLYDTINIGVRSVIGNSIASLIICGITMKIVSMCCNVKNRRRIENESKVFG